MVLCHHPIDFVYSLKISDIYCCWNNCKQPWQLNCDTLCRVEGFYQYNDVMCRHSVSEDDEVISWSEDGWIVTSVTSLSESGRAPSRSEPGRAGSGSGSGLLQQLPPRVKWARPGRGDQHGRLHRDTERGAGGISGSDIDWIYFYNFYVCVLNWFLDESIVLSLLFCGGD